MTPFHFVFDYLPVGTAQEFISRMSICLQKFPWLLAKHPEEGVIGYAYATTYKTRAAYRWTVETSVYVSSLCHRKNVGSMLYKSLFEILTHMGIRSIFVCIGIPNEKSIGFHKRLGFVEAGLFRRAGFKRGRWVDSMWLQKHLPEGEENLSAADPYTEDLTVTIPEPISIVDINSSNLLKIISKALNDINFNATAKT